MVPTQQLILINYNIPFAVNKLWAFFESIKLKVTKIPPLFFWCRNIVDNCLFYSIFGMFGSVCLSFTVFTAATNWQWGEIYMTSHDLRVQDYGEFVFRIHKRVYLHSEMMSPIWHSEINRISFVVLFLTLFMLRFWRSIIHERERESVFM